MVSKDEMITIVERHLEKAHACRQALESRGQPAYHSIGAAMALDHLLEELRETEVNKAIETARNK